MPIQNGFFLTKIYDKKIRNYSSGFKVQRIMKKPLGKKNFQAMKSLKKIHVVVYDASVHHQVVGSLQAMKNSCIQIHSLNQVRIMVLH
jgi:hypothetical protein